MNVIWRVVKEKFPRTPFHRVLFRATNYLCVFDAITICRVSVSGSLELFTF